MIEGGSIIVNNHNILKNKSLMEKEIEIEKYNELKLIANSEFDQITVADPEGVLIRVYRNCEKVFGIPEQEMIGKKGVELEKLGVLSKSVTALVAREKRRISLTQDTAAGRRLMVTGIPMFDDNGKMVKIINISRDITENERLERKLRETEEILEWFRNEMHRKQAIGSNYVVGSSLEIQNVNALINQIADTSATVLLLGETGVGKSFLAKVLHHLSRRRDKPFVQVSCGAIPENLLESELFGYETGAFTGASKKGKKGLFEIAKDGTIFLDEIAEIPMHIQAKLLSVLQEKQFYKVGGLNIIELNARIVAATNQDLKKLVEEGNFREDLYYRLNVLPVVIPPLRRRKEDIPIMARFFLDKFNKKYCTNKNLTQDAYDLLNKYDWPGNIRELENLIERLVITCTTENINSNLVLKNIRPKDKSDIEINNIIPLKNAVEQVEKQLLIQSLERYKTTRKMADALKISQSSVVKKLQKYNL